MNEFIHTVGIETYLSFDQLNGFYKAYGYHDDIYFYDHEEKKRVLCKYADRGFRMEIVIADKKVKQNDPQHRALKANWIVTPAKLLYPGQAMKKLYSVEEYYAACEELYKIIEEIKKDSGVDLLDDAKLRRVDIAKDIETPSEEYTHEVIRLAKKALKQYGYRLMAEVDEEKHKEEWKDKNGVFYYNKSQDVKAKIYNKIADMKLHDYDITGYSGLLRFELALSKGFLKKEKYMTEEYLEDDNLAWILGNALMNAHELLHKHITSPLWSGAMLSKELQKKYIWKYCGYKKDSEKYRKIIRYRNRHNKKDDKKSTDRKSVVRRYYLDMGLSPLYCSDAVRYIPSFADLLNGTENEEIKAFAERF